VIDLAPSYFLEIQMTERKKARRQIVEMGENGECPLSKMLVEFHLT
jgi:hypothetical protein